MILASRVIGATFRPTGVITDQYAFDAWGVWCKK